MASKKRSLRRIFQRLGLVRVLSEVSYFFAVIGYLHWQMALQAFSLITELPDRVMRWIGMQPEGLGERGETERATGFFVAGVNNRVESFGNAGLMKNALSGSGVPKGSDKGSSGKMGGIPKPK